MRKQMIGRASEQVLLRDLLVQARSGHGQFLMIIGEPGVGKSMLLNRLSSYAREADVTVLSGRAVEGAGTFRPLAEALMPPLRAGTLPESAELCPYRAALGRLLPDWASPSVPETSVDPILVLGEGLLRLLTALDPECCVLLLEDLHWADEEPALLTGTARVVEPLGADTLVVFDLAGCELQARLPPRKVRRAGDAVRVTIAPENVHLFDPVSGRRL